LAVTTIASSTSTTAAVLQDNEVRRGWGRAGDGRGLSAFASAHRGKWGQLTPLENG